MITENKAIVILGAAKFDGPYESTSFTTAKYLARNNKVFYADYPFTWKDYFRTSGTESFNVRKAGFRSVASSVLSTEQGGLSILILPLMLSINFIPEGKLYRFFLSLNENLIILRIKSVLKLNNIHDFIFINSFNFHYPNVGRLLQSKLYIYHCVDPLVIEYDKKHGLKSEQIIVEDVDLLFCTSKKLYEEKKLLNKNTFFIPNAADLNHASKSLNPDLEVHQSILKIPYPIIGYFGNIERRIDFNLLTEVVILNPEKSFVFVGPTSEEYILDGFKEHKNVYFIGRVPYEEMPSVIKGFDVCMIPFKKDEFSATIFPLKLFEYLGAAKPVVATNFNTDLIDFTKDVIPYCSNAKEFSNAIGKLLTQNNQKDLNQRLEIAKLNTWDIRLLEFSEIIADFYNRIELKNNSVN